MASNETAMSKEDKIRNQINLRNHSRRLMDFRKSILDRRKGQFTPIPISVGRKFFKCVDRTLLYNVFCSGAPPPLLLSPLTLPQPFPQPSPFNIHSTLRSPLLIRNKTAILIGNKYYTVVACSMLGIICSQIVNIQLIVLLLLKNCVRIHEFKNRLYHIIII